MTNLAKEYIENGYVIVPNLIPDERILNLLNCLENLKKRNCLYYSQSEHNWRFIKSDLDKNNLIESSFENFTNLIWAKGLSKVGKQILQSKEINEILKKLSGEDKFCMWQNMLFDKSTGTLDHLDTYYLDTDPMGGLVAAWIALENIDGEGGSFHVFPGSHKESSRDWINKPHKDYVYWCKELASKYKKKEALLNKGDVLFWHPNLLHGSSNQKVEGKSRKSLTAHYYPISFLKGGGGINSDKNSKSYLKKLSSRNKSFKFLNYSIESDNKNDLLFCTKGIIKYLLKNKPRLQMDRRKY